MGTTLNGTTPQNTYPSLIKVGDNGPIDGTLKTLSDGLGNDLPMQASSTVVNFTNGLQQGGTAVPTAAEVASKQATLVSGTNIKTINFTSLFGSGDIAISASPAGVAGAIQFSDGSAFASDAANLFWDDTNNRLGIGTNAPTNLLHVSNASRLSNIYIGQAANTAISNTGSDTTINLNNGVGISGGSIITPTARLHVKGSGTTSATTALLVQNSAGTDIVSVKDDLSVVFNAIITSASSTLRFDVGGVGTIRMSSDKVGIGGNVTPTARLHVKGSGTTSATTALLVQNSAGTAIMTSRDDLTTLLGGGLTMPNFVNITSGSNSIGFETARINFNATAGTFNNQYAFNFNDGGGNNTGTSGTVGRFSISSRFAPTSGTCVYNTALITPIINQTGGANGITRGLYINPTVTAAADFRAIEVTAGGAYINTSSVNASAILQADSTTKGFLPPRMTTAEKNAIATPAAGLVVYDSTVNRASVYSNAWENVITEVNASPNSVSNIWSGSQAQYDALTPNASTLYFIV